MRKKNHEQISKIILYRLETRKSIIYASIIYLVLSAVLLAGLVRVVLPNSKGEKLLLTNFSTDNSIESTKKSEGVIIQVSSILGLDFNEKQQQHFIEFFFVPVRKAAHFFIYFVLGITLISFLREFSIPIRRLILLSIVLAFLYACSDEFHQLFVSGRSGQFSDVLLDTFGASVGIGIYYLLFRKS